MANTAPSTYLDKSDTLMYTGAVCLHFQVLSSPTETFVYVSIPEQVQVPVLTVVVLEAFVLVWTAWNQILNFDFLYISLAE